MPPRTAPIRLLVVDDDDGIRALLEVTASLDPRFEIAGTAASAAEALRSAASAPRGDIDVILLDVTLPDRDGIDVVSELRAAGGDVRVVLFTGWSDRETLTRAREAGADAVFGKDGDPQRLLDGLAELSAGSASPGE